jgi:2'-5' RNA ligase
MIRAFAAIPMPEDVTDALEAVQDDLRIGNSVLPEHMHLTLVFLGELRGPDLDEVHHAFESVRAPAFDLRLHGLGLFGQSAPRSIHAAVEENAALRRLQAKLEQAARNSGVELPSRRFVPHVTIARLKGRRDEAAEAADFVARRSLVEPPPVHVRAFHLFRSILGRTGPVYDDLAQYPLG